MNNLIKLKGTLYQRANPGKAGNPELPKGKHINISHLEDLKSQLISILKKWEEDTLINGALININYISVIAKSRRVKNLFSKGKKSSNSTIVGAKFNKDKTKHIITHFVCLETLRDTIDKIQKCIDISRMEGKIQISDEYILYMNANKKSFKYKEILSENMYAQIVVDAYFVDFFEIGSNDFWGTNHSIITLYKTGRESIDILNDLGINLNKRRFLNDTTVLLDEIQLKKLIEKAPYLIAMGVTDVSQKSPDEFHFNKREERIIEKPKNQPTIGVIDTLFDKSVYFKEWVDYVPMIHKDFTIKEADYAHGTAVSSIIVDGPGLNPDLDDGCGHFKVRHFGVTLSEKFSSFSIMQSIKEIVANNTDIKVWNLSLGSELEISQNFISPEASILDELQYEYDIVFVVSATNKTKESTAKKIGAPADSINSIVVASATRADNPCSFAREGEVLSFFYKPDVSSYGGDVNEVIKAYSNGGLCDVNGTSYAAPWISRKLAYLIHVMGFNREVAKALIIDSAIGWEKSKYSKYLGYGVVPIKITDILQSKDDEIKFFIYGESTKYDTYNFNIPVPINNEKFPFVAKAVMSYFPYCSRSQGVDYTTTELELVFGRVTKKGVKNIDNIIGTDVPELYLYEKDARNIYRKWDNVKVLKEKHNDKVKPKMIYDDGLWGFSIKTKERLEEKYGENIKFGLVVTLKELNGINRKDEFIKQCSLRGWLVNEIIIDNQLEIFNRADEEIIFD